MIGRKLYEARILPLPWVGAMSVVFQRDDLDENDTMTAHQLAREYAWKAGKPWPPECELSRTGRQAARLAARSKPIRDWLILTDGPARFASALPAPA